MITSIMGNKKKLQPVLIEWLDSKGIYSDWRHESDGFEDIKLCYCHSVGYIVKKTLRAVSIASHATVQDDRQYNGIMTIPVCAIKKITKLRVL